jgi:8-oxo-dGTP pyrophosphatase MutT (NUDIX family)
MTSPRLETPGADVVPVPAATVALVRDGADGLQTWMMRRVRAMAFAPGAAVFPGGRVDPRDADASVPWSGSAPEAAAARMGTDAATARALVTAAVRELFEETCVLLVDPRPTVPLGEARAAVESRQVSLAAFLADHGCQLDAAALRPWARWITPPTERRRYDTWFFIAAMPADSEARAVSSEADAAGWIGVREALDAQAAGEMRLLPPTLTMLRGLDAAGSVAAVLAAAPARSLEAVHPQITLLADGSVRLLAAGAEFLFPSSAGQK